jgi:hypothetical protein
MQNIARKSIADQLVSQQAVLDESLLESPEFLLRIYKQYYPNQKLPIKYFSNFMIVAITPNKKPAPKIDSPIAYNNNSISNINPTIEEDSLNIQALNDPFLYDSLLLYYSMPNLLPDEDRQHIQQHQWQPFVYDTLYQDSTLYTYFVNDSLQRDSLTFDQETWFTIVVDSTSLVMDSLLNALPLKPKTVQASIQSCRAS